MAYISIWCVTFTPGDSSKTSVLLQPLSFMSSCVLFQNWPRRSFRPQGSSHQLCDIRRPPHTEGHRDLLQYASRGDAHERGRPDLAPTLTTRSRTDAALVASNECPRPRPHILIYTRTTVGATANPEKRTHPSSFDRASRLWLYQRLKFDFLIVLNRKTKAEFQRSHCRRKLASAIRADVGPFTRFCNGRTSLRKASELCQVRGELDFEI